MFTSLILGFTNYSQGIGGKRPSEIHSGVADIITGKNTCPLLRSSRRRSADRHGAGFASIRVIRGPTPGFFPPPRPAGHNP